MCFYTSPSNTGHEISSDALDILSEIADEEVEETSRGWQSSGGFNLGPGLQSFVNSTEKILIENGG